MPKNIVKLNDNMEFTGDVFIIPNAIKRACDMPSMGGNLAKTIERLNQLNGTTFDESNTRCVEVWITIPNLTENLSAHGFYSEDDYNRIWKVIPELFGDLLPVSLFEDKKEGDDITITLPAIASSYDDSDPEENPFKEKSVALTLTLTLNQREYRYRSFGTFEECLEKLLSR